MMWEHQANCEAESFTGRSRLPKPVEVVHGCVGNVLIVDLVRALAAAGQLEAHSGRAGRTRKGAVIDRSRTTGPVRAVVSDVAFSKAVQLVRTIEVHSAELDRAVSCRAERVGVRGYGRIERLVVRPDFVFVWEPARDQGHARRDTDRRGAVGRRKTGAAGRQAVEVRRFDDLVSVASRDGRIVLVGLDEQDIRAVGMSSGGVWFCRTIWAGQCDSPGVRKGDRSLIVASIVEV